MPKVQRSKTRTATAAIQRKSAPANEPKPVQSVNKTVTGDLTKDQKRKLRHEAWLEKLDRAYAVQKKQKKKKGQLKADLSDMGDILSTIKVQDKQEQGEQKDYKPPVIPTDKIQSKKAKKKAELQEIARFQKVMQLPAFKENPLAAIRQHVQNTFQAS